MLDTTTSRLPEDVIFDVLSRLPLKPLCRFRCVSKAWHALISDPAFIAAQSSRDADPLPVLLIGVFQGQSQRLPPSRSPAGAPPRSRPTQDLRVMDMRGNVLRVVRDVEDRKLRRARLDLVRHDGDLYGAAAVDPATGRAVAVRRFVDERAPSDAVDPDTPWIRTGRVFTRLGSDDRISYSGFGRAAVSGVYKAVRLIKSWPSVRAEVATLDGGAGDKLTWRQGPVAPFLPCCAPWCTPTVAGVLYYLPCSSDCLIPGRNRVAAFDLETEEWKPTIEFPEGVKMQMSLVELKGTLAMVHFEAGPRSCQTNVWMLDDSERGVWVKQHAIQMHKSWRVIEPLEILSDGRMLLLNLVETQEHYSYPLGWVLQLRDPNTGAHTDLMQMPREYRDRMTIYRGSILC
ncbi:unnamed protein product [Urochloa decumbens]|uniref:F-box domain-containing protein n=1 Tax=Urochloa decumbens TaxID=240449 RepID=A0ABC9DJD5_9POAL